MYNQRNLSTRNRVSLNSRKGGYQVLILTAIIIFVFFTFFLYQHMAPSYDKNFATSVLSTENCGMDNQNVKSDLLTCRTELELLKLTEFIDTESLRIGPSSNPSSNVTEMGKKLLGDNAI